MLPFVYDELLDLRAGGTNDAWLAPLATWGMALHLLGTVAVYNAWIRWDMLPAVTGGKRSIFLPFPAGFLYAIRSGYAIMNKNAKALQERS